MSGIDTPGIKAISVECYLCRMATISLEGMSFFAHHGYYTHERERGGNYLVDVSVDDDLERAALGDDLRAAINYEVIYQICSEIMDQPVKLIETLAYRIGQEVRKKFPGVQHIRVVVTKLSPELGGPVSHARITYTLD